MITPQYTCAPRAHPTRRGSPDPLRTGRPRRWLLTSLAAMAALILAGCGGGGGSQTSGSTTAPGVTAAILDPADASTDVPTALDISFTTENAVETSVTLEELDGDLIDGEFVGDGSVWRPMGQLEYGTTYIATLTAVGEDGQNAITTSTFTTMAEPSQTVWVFSFLGPDQQIGVGMPLRIEFQDGQGRLWEIPQEYRAAVERRMTVKTEPAQEGSWHWVSGAEVHYRPKEFWQPGTQISYRLATGGLGVGEGWYLRNDINVNLSVGSEILMEVDNSTRQMKVTVDGEVARTIPVSLGQADWPSSSGTFVIMEKFTETVFDTREEMGADGYVVDIEYAMRLTYRGEFIHATVRDGTELGNANVTHGCINMSRDNAEWLFELTHAWGDPVVVTGTSRPAEPGNGWTDWNVSWEEYQRGSALYQS